MLSGLEPLKKDRVVMLPPEKISPNPNQPRRYFAENELIKLSESISRYGVIQPITVRRRDDDGYEIICGERRLRAAMMSGLLKVPCIVRKTDSRDSAAIALTENLLRKNLNCFEEANAISELITSFNMTQEEIAVVLGKTQGAVANKLRLLKLSEEIREMILQNFLTERHARLLLNLRDDEERVEVLNRIIDKKMNVAAAEKYVADRLMNGKKEPRARVKKFYSKDIRIFVNTINHAVAVMKKSGIEAIAVQTDGEDSIEYIITIPKPTLT